MSISQSRNRLEAEKPAATAAFCEHGGEHPPPPSSQLTTSPTPSHTAPFIIRQRHFDSESAENSWGWTSNRWILRCVLLLLVGRRYSFVEWMQSVNKHSGYRQRCSSWQFVSNKQIVVLKYCFGEWKDGLRRGTVPVLACKMWLEVFSIWNI